ncbi:MAG: DNA ligase (NAD(+)) LigA, partial [Chitinophagaceae bacterium]
LVELRDGTEVPIEFPKTCPSCGDALFRPEEEAAWRCINIACPAQVLERLYHFVSKDAMDIRGLGAANIEKFHKLGLLSSIPGIYRLDFDAIGALEGFGAKSVEKLRAAIESSKAQPLHRLVFALGIRHVGETMAKTLANAVQHVGDLAGFSVEQLMELEDVGPKVAASVHAFFRNDDSLALLRELEALGLTVTNEPKAAAGGSFEGQSFLFTGTMSRLKRSQAEALVEQQGGSIASGVSSKLHYLVVGTDAGSKLEKAKKITSIKILSEEQFIALIGEGFEG